MNILRTLKQSLCIISFAFTSLVHAATVAMNRVDANGSIIPVGTIEVSYTKHGVLFMSNLKGLPLGIHAFHVHTNLSRSPAM